MAEVVATSEEQNLRFSVRRGFEAYSNVLLRLLIFIIAIQTDLDFLSASELAFPKGVGIQDQTYRCT